MLSAEDTKEPQKTARRLSISPDQFIESTLKRLLQHSEGRKSRPIKEACINELRKMKALQQAKTPLNTADQVFTPFKLACESSSTTLVAVALDCIHQLIAARVFSGSSPVNVEDLSNTKGNVRTVDLMVETVFNCANRNDDVVQLQVLKAMLTAVGSVDCQVHEQSLMYALKSSYHVYLSTRNVVNQTTARASLTQMLSIVFNRMEKTTEQLKELKEEVKVQVKTEREREKGKFGWCIVCGKTADHYCLQTHDPVCSMPCKHSNLKRTLAMEVSISDDPSDDEERARKVLTMKAQLLQNDAFLMFRALCKLAGKQSSAFDASASKSKTLALELLLSVLDSCGPTFRNGKRFVDAVREHLVQALLNNCVSTDLEVFRLSLAIFAALVRNFKVQLKNQIGIFMDHIFLRIGAYSNSSFNQRQLVLQVFYKMCLDSETIVGFFANYDCDPESSDIFGNMIQALDRITKDKSSNEGYITGEQKTHLKVLAVKCSVAILQSILQWHEDHAESAQVSEEVDDIEHVSGDGSSEHSEHELPSPMERVKLSEKYEQQRQIKENMSTGIVKFNMKPKKGIEYLRQHNLLKEGEKNLALFFRNTKGLSKEVIGEFFGKDDPYHQSVLNAYLDLFQFENMSLDQSMRYFFTQFRVPKETQQIDRIMEKFAGAYCSANPEVFASADIAYVLTYAILMLNTDAHNPQVKNKMSKESFIKTYMNIDEELRLEASFLEAIFDRIVSDEIKMTDDPSSVFAANVSSQQQKQIFSKEINEMLQLSSDLIRKDQSNKNDPVYLSSDYIDAEALRTMFEFCWPSALATFSILLQESSELHVIRLCLEGYRYAIRISSIFSLPTQKHAFVNSLAGFTLLGSMNEMKEKNIEAIKMLLTIAFYEGNYLKESWAQVLRCISECERLQLVGNGIRSDAVVFSQSPKKNMKQLLKSEHESKNSHSLLLGIEQDFIDRVFSQSSSLNSEAIIDFVENLCAISRFELEHPKNPRIFSLQKIVEITYYNMGRIRLVWSRIWQILAKHFEFAGKHSNANISMYAIDSLRQLSSKFLEKDELANFHFQKQFLRPFESMVTNKSREVREFVLQCLMSLVLARVRNVKSGWRVVFSILTRTAAEEIEKIVTLTWTIVEALLRDYGDLIVESLDECVACLIAFANNSFTEISLKSIGCLEKLSKSLDEHYKLTPKALEDNPMHLEDTSNPNARIWFHMLTGLSTLTSDTRIEVRTRALSVLFNTLMAFGKHFGSEIWILIFRGVLMPIFDDMDLISEQSVLDSGSLQRSHSSSVSIAEDIVSENSWARTTCVQALEMLVELFEADFNCLSQVLDEMVLLCSKAVQQPHTDLIRAGLQCWVRLAVGSGNKFSETQWDGYFKQYLTAVVCNLPHQVMLQYPKESSEPLAEPYHSSITSFDFEMHRPSVQLSQKAIRIKCMALDLLLNGLFDICLEFYSKCTEKQRNSVLDCFLVVTRFAQRVNSSLALRIKLHEQGFWLNATGADDFPHLYAIESTAVRLYVKVILPFYEKKGMETNRCKEAVEVLLRRSLFLETCKEQSKDHLLELSLKEPVVCFILEQFMAMREDGFGQHFIDIFLNFFVESICCDSVNIRRLLQQVFQHHIRNRISLS